MKAADLLIGECYAYAPFASADLSDPRCVCVRLLGGPRDIDGKGKRWPVDVNGTTVWAAGRYLHGPWAEHLAERQRIVRQAAEARERIEQMHQEIGRWVAAMNERLRALGFPESAGTPRGRLGLVLESPYAERLLELAEAGLRATTKEQTMVNADETQAAPEPDDDGLTAEQLAELDALAAEGGADPEPSRQELYEEHARQAAAGEVDG